MRIPLMSISRFGFGIKGLDEMLSGGLLRKSLFNYWCLGTGKTNFAQYYIWQGLIQAQSAFIYYS
jgi:KaiC/GvpD/RAD55 family RecA-like ATPase